MKKIDGWELFKKMFKKKEDVIVIDVWDKMWWGKIDWDDDFLMLSKGVGKKKEKIRWNSVRFVSHDGFPAIDVGEQIAVGIPPPAMGNQHDALGHPFVYAGLHFHPTPIALHQDRIPVFNAVHFSGFRTDLGEALGANGFQGTHPAVLAVRVV